MSKELDHLLSQRQSDLKPWVIGKIPKHIKRCSVSDEKALELAKYGATEIFKYFGMRLFFCQALMAGAILCGEYDDFTISTPSQYGKSNLMGRLAILKAFQGKPVYIAGATQELAHIIMRNAIAGLKEASSEIQEALTTRKGQVDRLLSSLSKTRVAFASKGFVQAISLADTYTNGVAKNKALGVAGDTFLDEAALVSEQSKTEIERARFAKLDGTSYQTIEISNPHQPGSFYDDLTNDKPDERHFILWIDALTAIEEERFTENQVRKSKWDKNIHERRKYLLCELDVESDTMFKTPMVYEGEYTGDYTTYFLGLDSAYKGKDNITVALNAVDENGMSHIEDIHIVDKGDWKDGETEELILNDISRIARYYRVPLICADQGWGVWLIRGLTERGIACKGVSFGERPTKERVKAGHYAARNAADKRTEMHLDLQNLLEDGMIEFSEKAWDKVKDTFPFVKAEYQSNGKIRVIKKSEIKAKIGKSPDELDAVLLSIYAPQIIGIV